MSRYVDGFVLPVPKDNMDAYRQLARQGRRDMARARRARIHRMRCR